MQTLTMPLRPETATVSCSETSVKRQYFVRKTPRNVVWETPPETKAPPRQ